MPNDTSGKLWPGDEVLSKLNGVMKICLATAVPSAPLAVVEALLSIATTLNTEVTEWQEKALMLERKIDALMLERDSLARQVDNLANVCATNENVLSEMEARAIKAEAVLANKHQSLL